MGGECYLSGSVSMSRQALDRLLAQDSGISELVRRAIDEQTLSYSNADRGVVLDGMYVSWDSDAVIDGLAENKDVQSVDIVDWVGEGHDGPLSDVMVYFVGPGRWLAKAIARPRLSSRERNWLLGT